MKNSLANNRHISPDRKFSTLYEEVEGNGYRIALSHPKYKGRSDRLDLITNKMIGIKVSINSKTFLVCDISKTGFSYAEKVPVKKNLSFKQVKFKVDQIASSNYGKALKCLCFFGNKEDSNNVQTTGVIRNHNVFLVLSPDEIRQTVTSHLQRISIRRSHDPEGYFQKLDLLLEKSSYMREKGFSISSLSIVLNISFQNLIGEIGAPSEIFETLYQGYINKPVYVKYGISVDNRKEALDLLNFARIKDNRRIKTIKKQKEKSYENKTELIKKLNQIHTFHSFVEMVWKNCLTYFELQINTELPKIEKVKVAQKLSEEKKVFNGHIEKLADYEYKEGDSAGLETYLSNGLYWYLIEKDKKYFDREIIKKEIRRLIVETYEDCLDKAKFPN